MLMKWAAGDIVCERNLPLIPPSFVIERNFGGAAPFGRLDRSEERLATTLWAIHFLAFACVEVV